MNKGTSFLLVGNATYSNRGCEAIVRGTVVILRRCFEEEIGIYSAYFDDGALSDSRSEKDPTVKHLPVSWPGNSFFDKLGSKLTPHAKELGFAVQFVKNKSFNDAVHEADIIMMVGGDNFSFDYWDPSPFLAFNEYFLKKGKKVVIWGSSIGPFSSKPDFEKIAARELRKCTMIFSRESHTTRYLNTLGLSNHVQIADPAFALVPEPVVLDESIERCIAQGCIGINLSPLLSKYRSSLTEWIRDCADCIVAIQSGIKMPILLIAHVYPHETGIKGDDLLFLAEVHKKIVEKDPDGSIRLLQGSYSAGQLKHIISRMILFAGARTHSTIAAFSSCVPTICFGYSMKARGILNDIYQNEKWLIEKERLNEKALPGIFQDMLSKRNEIRDHLNRVIPEFIAKSFSAGIKVQSLLRPE